MMLDYGRLSAPHLQLMLKASLRLYGISTQVFDAQTFNNPYKTIYPEKAEAQTPSFICKVLIRQRFEGLNISNDLISLTDKTETEFELICDERLHVNQILHMKLPDNRQIYMRITAALTTHPLSQVAFVFKAVTF